MWLSIQIGLHTHVHVCFLPCYNHHCVWERREALKECPSRLHVHCLYDQFTVGAGQEHSECLHCQAAGDEGEVGGREEEREGGRRMTWCSMSLIQMPSAVNLMLLLSLALGSTGCRSRLLLMRANSAGRNLGYSSLRGSLASSTLNKMMRAAVICMDRQTDKQT